MGFSEWWTKQSDYEVIKNSRKYGLSFVRLLCENAWNSCELEMFNNNKNKDISPSLEIPKSPATDVEN